MATFFGMYRGTVVNNVDPEKRGRLLVQVPQVLGMATTDWALPSVPVGLEIIPASVGEPVWVMFEAGDVNRPIWTGIGFATPLAQEHIRTTTISSVIGLQSALDLKAPVAGTVTLATAQTITGTKTFSVAPVVPSNAWAIASTSGLQTALDSKYSPSNPIANMATTDTAQTFTAAAVKTFTAAPVVPDSSWTIAKTSGLQASLDSKVSSATAVSSVNSRTGAVTGLAEAADVVTLATTQTISGTKTNTGGFWLNRSIPVTGTAGTSVDLLRVGPASSVFAHPNGTAYVGNNVYFDGTSWRSIMVSNPVGAKPSVLLMGGALTYRTWDSPTAAGAALTGETERFSVSSVGDAVVTGGTLKVQGASTEGYVMLTRGQAGRSGYAGFHKADGTRTGYIGWSPYGAEAADQGTLEYVAARHSFVNNGYAMFGPNSFGAYLQVGGNDTRPQSTIATVQTTSGNLHLDAGTSGFGIYLNWFGGGSSLGTVFGNGVSGQVARIDAAGSFSCSGEISTINNYVKANVGGSYETRIGEIVGGGGLYCIRNNMIFYVEGPYSWSWRVNNVEKMYLTNDARLVVGGGRLSDNESWTTSTIECRDLRSPRVGYHQPGEVASSFGQIDNSEDLRTFDNGGGAYRAITASAFYNGSSERYKTGVTDLAPSKKEGLKLLRVVEYQNKVEPVTPEQAASQTPPGRSRKMRTDEAEVGLLAEEVHRVYPHLVQIDGAGRPDAVNYSGLVPYLLSAVQTLQAEVATLRAERRVI